MNTDNVSYDKRGRVETKQIIDSTVQGALAENSCSDKLFGKFEEAGMNKAENRQNGFHYKTVRMLPWGLCLYFFYTFTEKQNNKKDKKEAL